MKRIWRWLRPDSLGAQIAMVLFAAIVLYQAVVATIYIFSDPASRTPIIEPAEAIAGAATAIDHVMPERRAEMIADVARIAPWLKFSVLDEPPGGVKTAPATGFAELIRKRLWPGAVVLAPEADIPLIDNGLTIALRQGGYLSVTITQARRSEMLEEELRGTGIRRLGVSHNLENSAALFLVSALLLTIWLTLAVITPLYRLMRQAEKLPVNRGKYEPIKETGPMEIRELSRALNRMQGRIESMIESRSRALAAISHDLRTIITRLRLRSEFIGDDALKSKMLKDVETMDSMLHKNLVYLRGEKESTGAGLIDLDSVLQTIVDEFSDLGHEIGYAGGQRQTVYGSLEDLQRLFSNLVENAVNHGRHVFVTASAPKNGFILVDVADDGPGIPAAMKDQLLEPFVRGEPARTLDSKSGFGLGLSIVVSLVEQAGGKFQLLDRPPNGLIARVALPAAFN